MIGRRGWFYVGERSLLRLRAWLWASVLAWLFILPFVYAGEDQGPARPVRLTFNNPYGPVAFDHGAHAQSCSKCHPPFDFKFEDGKGYSVRAHQVCVSCHRTSGQAATCDACHRVQRREEIPFDPGTMKSASEARQGVLDFFFERRSIRKFQDRGVPEALIHDLLRAAMAAPTAGNWQPWEFIVVRNRETVEALSDTSPFAGFARGAAVVIVVAGRRDNAWSSFDCALASGNILLAAANFGLGATYAGLDDEREALVRRILGIPDAYVVYNLIPLGFPAEEKAPHTKYNPGRIHWDRFEAGRPVTTVSK